MALTDFDRALIAATQGGLPLVARPYEAVGAMLGVSGEQVRQRRGFGGHHKPHIQAVGAAVVVRHLGEAIDHGIDHIKALFGHGNRCQHKLAPSAFDLEQGAKAGEHAPRQQLVQALDDALFAPAQLRPNGGKGALIQRKTAVQVVDQ